MAVTDDEIYADGLRAVGTIRFHAGYEGWFTDHQCIGAWPNGTRVEKLDVGGDVTKAGTLGTILGSLRHPERGFGYFIEWDDKPLTAILCSQAKMKRCDDVS